MFECFACQQRALSFFFFLFYFVFFLCLENSHTRFLVVCARTKKNFFSGRKKKVFKNKLFYFDSKRKNVFGEKDRERDPPASDCYPCHAVGVSVASNPFEIIILDLQS
jgi:hypothetical protein